MPDRTAKRRPLPAVCAGALLGVVAVAGASAVHAQDPAKGAASPAERGLAVYEARCSGCHSVDAHRVGPLHRGVLGRRAGAVPGYDYSPALRASTLVWSPATLKAWLADPEAVIPGQGMGYRLGDAREREDVVAYLATLGTAASAAPGR